MNSQKIEKDCEIIYLKIQTLMSALINVNVGHSMLVYLALTNVAYQFSEP